MEHERRALAGPAAGLGVADVTFEELDAVERLSEVLPPARREVVHRAHPGSPLEQRVHEVRPDESGRARDQDALAVELRERLSLDVLGGTHAFTTLGSGSR